MIVTRSDRNSTKTQQKKEEDKYVVLQTNQWDIISVITGKIGKKRTHKETLKQQFQVQFHVTRKIIDANDV